MWFIEWLGGVLYALGFGGVCVGVGALAWVWGDEPAKGDTYLERIWGIAVIWGGFFLVFYGFWLVYQALTDL